MDKLSDDKTLSDYIALTGENVLVCYFNADWNRPGITAAPDAESAAAAESVRIVEASVYDCRDVAAKYGVTGVPATLVFKNGRLVVKEIGVRSSERIRKLIQGEPE